MIQLLLLLNTIFVNKIVHNDNDEETLMMVRYQKRILYSLL